MTRFSIARLLAAFSLITLLVACGGGGGGDREEGPDDRETPSLGEPKDDGDGDDDEKG